MDQGLSVKGWAVEPKTHLLSLFALSVLVAFDLNTAAGHNDLGPINFINESLRPCAAYHFSFLCGFFIHM